MNRVLVFCIAGLLMGGSAVADAPAPAPTEKPADSASPPSDPDTPDTWIFSGVLEGSREGYSGTLVAHGSDSEFEMKLTSGVTCEGGQLKAEVGLVRLPEITCTDDRVLRALFVPQGNLVLKVFGHLGDERFSADAHLLGTEPIPEPKQTAQPKGPLGLPPPGMTPPPGK